MYSDEWFEEFADGLEADEVTWENLMYLDSLIESATLDPYKTQFLQTQIHKEMDKEAYLKILFYVKNNQPNLQQLNYLPGATKLTKYINNLQKTKR